MNAEKKLKVEQNDKHRPKNKVARVKEGYAMILQTKL
jgi:hypothetical protein